MSRNPTHLLALGVALAALSMTGVSRAQGADAPGAGSTATTEASPAGVISEGSPAGVSTHASATRAEGGASGRSERATAGGGGSDARGEFAASHREPFADAPGVTPIDEPLRPTSEAPDRQLILSGFYRARGDLAYNWDLGTGPTPSGNYLWGGSYIDGGRGRLQTNLDMRLRVDAEARIGYGVTLFARLHVLDNLRFGSTPDADFVGGVVTQRSPADPIQVRQLWGQVVLPFGVLRVGRMGAPIDWGTGFFVSSGSGLDDDFGDVGDRISFTLPAAGLLWSALYEVSAGGPGSDSVHPEVRPAFDLDPRDEVRSAAFAVARWDTPQTRRRRLAAGRTSFEFGAIGSLRWQDWDTAPNVVPSAATAIRRGLTAFVGDLWVRLDVGRFTLEGELALSYFNVQNASLDPAVSINSPITGTQYGAVVRGDYRASPRLFARIELGLASGDASAGFGARPVGANAPRPGDLDGPQFDLARSPADTTIDNFRFHPNYRVDLILFRRIIGLVTDAAYIRPMVRYRLASMLTFEGAVIASTAMQPNSTPSGAGPLGVETDLTAIYEQEHGFVASLTYGFLVPLSGFRNVARGVDPSPAHALHLVAAYRF